MRRIALGARPGRGRSRLWLSLAAVLAGPGLTLGMPGPAMAKNASPLVPVMVQYDTGSAGRAEAAVRALGGKVNSRFNALDGLRAELPADRLGALRTTGGVRSVSADATVRLSSSGWSSDGSGEQNTMSTVAATTGASTIWSRTDSQGRKITGKGIGVALIDSGVAPVKGLTGPGKVINGPDLSFESQAPNLRYLDTYGHGTHMAGIIAGQDPPPAAGTNSPKPAPFSGMAPDATLINMKVAAVDGAVDVSQVIAAIDWVVTHRNDPGLNIRVLNLSFGTDSTQDPRLDPMSYAVEAAWRKGIVVVVAAGNDGPTATRLSMPAANPYVLSVGASDGLGTSSKYDDVVADFSTKGSSARHPDLVAPGKSVISLRNPNSYIDLNYPTGLVPGDTESRLFRGSGTSQATAVVSGAAALLLQQRPTLTPDQVKTLLTSTATSMPKADPIGQGAGQLNLAAASWASTPRLAAQAHPAAAGTGSLELSRGTAHLVDPDSGTELRGEQDIMGQAWNPSTWTTACAAGTAWNGGTWNSRTWSGSAWNGTSWASQTWATAAWTGANWTSRTWSSRTWSDAAWTTSGWSSGTWAGRTWSGRTWSGRTWSGRTWSGRTWSGGYW
jgi:serine protease AprX